MTIKFFNNYLPSIVEISDKYPCRQTNGEVTRFAPSPTGFLHLGGVYAALISKNIAKHSNGVFYIRIEDTDQAREIPGAVDMLFDTLKIFELDGDEHDPPAGNGKYGPYRQSSRRNIYQAYAKYLLDTGLAYPCFASTNELESNIQKQKDIGINPGYYGEWAIWRNKSQEDIAEAIEKGIPFVIRLRSQGNINDRIQFNDLIRGTIELPGNHHDIVIIKSDGLPTYHFAHAVDDHLMKTSIIIRGDEWISSIPLHVELFSVIDAIPPKYAHIAPLQIQDGSSRRKLSKRKDPEADVRFYLSQGYMINTIIAYLMTIANSQFESWHVNNINSDPMNFPLKISSLGESGALLDINKISSIGKEHFISMPIHELVANGVNWAKTYNQRLYDIWSSDINFFKQVLETQRENPKRPRKDLSKWADFHDTLGFFYDDLFNIDEPIALEIFRISNKNIISALNKIVNGLNSINSSSEWATLVKQSAVEEGLETGKLKPDTNISSHITSVYGVMKLSLTGNKDCMDIWTIIRTLGIKKSIERISKFIR